MNDAMYAPSIPSYLSLSSPILEPLGRLWCNATLQSRLVLLELQTMDSQARISKNCYTLCNPVPELQPLFPLILY